MAKTFIKIGLVGAGLALLTGCATTQTMTKPPVSNDMSSQDKALEQSINKIVAATNSLRTAPTPYDGFPVPTQGKDQKVYPKFTNGPLAEPLHVEWSGDAAVLLGSLAKRWGWQFQDKLPKTENPQVRIHVQSRRGVDILSEIAKQLPKNQTLTVKDKLMILEAN